MSTGNLAYLVAAAAIAGPTLLTEAAGAGIEIPTWVTPGQAAAMAVLRAPFSVHVGIAAFVVEPPTKSTMYTRDSANTWLTNVVHKVAPFRPGSTRNPLTGAYNLRGFAVGREDAELLCKRLLAAAEAGVTAEKAYKTRALTKSLEDVAYVYRRYVDGFFAADELTRASQSAIMAALGDLVIAMDDAGLLITGKPSASDEPTIWGGIKHAAGASVDFVLVDVPTSVAGFALETAGAAAFSTLGMFVIGGYLVYRVVKKS